MRATVTLFIAGLVALSAAVPHPYPQDAPEPSSVIPEPVPATSAVVIDSTAPVPQSTSLNIPITVPSGFPTALPIVNGSSSSRHRKSHYEPIPSFMKSCDCPALATVPYPCWATDSLQKCNFEELHSFVCWTSAAYGCPSPTRSCADLFAPTPITGRNPCELGPNTGDAEPVITAAPAPLRRWEDMAVNPEYFGVRK